MFQFHSEPNYDDYEYNVWSDFVLAQVTKCGQGTDILLQELRCQQKKPYRPKFGYEVVENLGRYLGVPLLHSRVTKATYSYLIEKVEQRLSGSGWAAKTLSFAGRITLAKAVLQTISSYAMQSSWLPKGVCTMLEKLIRRFVWNANEGSNPLALIKWSTVKLPKENGGLAIKHLEGQNKAFLLKIGMQLVQGVDKLWVKVIRSKYRWSDNGFMMTSRRRGSWLWNGLKCVWGKIQKSLFWSVKNGNRIDFWNDIWLDDTGPLIHHSLVGANPPAVMISSLVTASGEWDMDRIKQLNHRLTVRSAYKVLMAPVPIETDASWSEIWALNVPRRIQTFLWLAVHGRLLTNAERLFIWLLLIFAIFVTMRFQDFVTMPIWKRRYSLLLQPNYMDKDNLLVDCFKIKNEIIAARGAEDGNNQLQSQKTCWQKPPLGWVRGNSDGTMDCLSKMATAGGVIRVLVMLNLTLYWKHYWEWYLRLGFSTSLLSDREQGGLSRTVAAVRLVSGRCRGRGKQPEGMKNEDWALLDRQALEVIQLTLSRNVAFNIAKEKTTAGLMAALSSMYEKPSASNKVHLMRRLFNLRMTQGASVAQHLNELNTITTQLSSVEIEFDDEVRALILLSSLPDSWNATVTAVIRASFHSTPCREIMENYVSGDFGKVHLADDETLKILDEEGYSKTFSGCEWKITKGALVIARGKKTDTLYVTSNLENIIAVTDADRKSNLWHQRLGHMSEKVMKTLLSKRKLSDLKNVDVGICEDCIFGKQKKVSFAKIGKTLKAEMLELVHTDVWGSSPVPSLAGSLYYVTFIDDSTRKAMVENETGLKVKRSRSDNGGEYRNRRFRDFCANNGIKMETTVPMTPQQNGVAERMNRTLNEHFAERSKLDAKSNKCAFVGYGGDEFGYRFWDYENRKIIISRDVIFNENDEAMQVDDSVKWESSMKDEMDSLMSNQTWELAELSPGKKALHNKWIYRIKEEHDGSKRYKARLVVKGFQQKECIDYNEIFSPVVKLSTIRLPEGFIETGKKNLVCRLKKSLYGLKQAPRQWYKKFDSFMSSSGFTRCQADHCCYIKRLRHARDYKFEAKIVEAVCNERFGCSKADSWDEDQERHKVGDLLLSQAEYINKVLSRFNMQDAKPVSTPLGVHFRLSEEQSPKTEEERAQMVKVMYASAIGSLIYDMVCTRPDIAQAVGAVSRYMNNPGKVHWKAVKWILRYLRGTTNKALCFKGGDTTLTGYVDADLAENVNIRMSTTGYVYTLGGTAVSWVSQLHKIVSLSTTEAEYVAVIEASKEMV
ncbi:hypothetical protein F3Y22_tig00112857pilonHSYRG00227 [Hibiscus syriacus]|uniref:Integrase catalytic domain-containing protein n=1 Tax=Hibiscus syriacus TaxID=106335 RepID=A0A6A2Y2I4_HIBSY|nr:hypothetical protein F3Y22_tig00112857pilonHSYRG00227 [Hibiscus syriacus]